MGTLTQTVLEGLKGQTPSLSSTSTKTGKSYEKKLAAQQMALLLTVASQQEAQPGYNCEEPPAWEANPETIFAYTHTKSSAFHDDRNFLVKLGLLEYSKSKYRVCIGKLRNAELSATKSPPELRNTELSQNEKYVERVAKSISDKLHISTEDIDRKALINAIKDKFPDTIQNVINTFSTNLIQNNNLLNQMLSKLSTLCNQHDDPQYKKISASTHIKTRRDRGGKGPQTKEMQNQLSSFKGWLFEGGKNPKSPKDVHSYAIQFWRTNSVYMEKAKKATGQKKGYTSQKVLANAYWNDLGKCPKSS